MSRTSKHIADKYIDRLPEGEEYYKLEDLRSRGFPMFIIRRIQIEVERNLAESIVPPQTDWANMKVPAVQEAWDRFLNAIRSDARLPASYARPVLETVLEDIIDLLVQPRKNLPEIIFGSSDELSYDELNHRVQAIVVYRHFASLIPRYMERKEMDRLTKSQCELIVSKADEKLTRHYTPLNWAQILEPLFTLFDEQIDSSFLHLFFEDKKMPRIARSFDLMNRSLNRAQLIEVLSSPELLNFEGYEEDQSDLFGGGGSEQHGEEPVARESGKKPKEKAEPAGAETASEIEEDDEGDPIVTGFHKNRKVIPQSETDPLDEDPGDSLNAIFNIEEDESAMEPPVAEEEEAETEDTESLNALFQSEEELELESVVQETGETPSENIAEIEEEKPAENEEDGLEEEPDEQNLSVSGMSQGEEPDERTPMWERFMDPETKAEMLKQQRKDEPEVEDEDNDDDESVMEGFIEEPIFDISSDDGPDPADLEQMHGLLEGERRRFVDEIFRGSESAYEDAIRELVEKEDWRSASRYIEKEVFKRNLVDMYSETAVDFTDRLQTYFIKSTKSNRS